MTAPKYFTDAMPCRSGDYKPLEKLAKDLAGGVGWHDSQPWIPAVKTPIVYPERKSRQTKIPLESSWNDFQPGCYPVCRHTPDQCPTKPEYDEKSSWERRRPGQRVALPSIPDPEGHQLPEGMRFRGSGQVINKMTFDEKPWLDTAPLEVQAKEGYTNFSNDHAALVNAFEKGLFRTDGQCRWYREGWGPGEFWAKEDRKHRKAGVAKLCTADASKPPTLQTDSLASLCGRRCRNCYRRVSEDAHGKVRYCSERCRNRGEYARRRGLAGTVSPGIELSSFAVDGRRIGIDTDDLGFYQLLEGVA